MFSMVVQLYRALQRPPVAGNVFAYAGPVEPLTLDLIRAVQALPAHFGFFEHCQIDGSHVDLEFSLPATREFGRFHSSIATFIDATPSLEWGNPPENFFVLDLNFFSLDETVPTEILRLRECCEFIKLLSRLATDAPVDERKSNANRLTFVLVADGKSPVKTMSLVTKVTEKMLAEPILHLNLLRALLSDERKNQIHVEERRSIMRLALAETIDVLASNPQQFEALVLRWGEVLGTYRHNVLAFLHQFSFQKVRKEIANAQIEYATKLSAVLGDVAGKMLALPLSFAGLVLLRASTEFSEFVIYALGLTVITVTLLGILLNQWVQVRRLADSFQIVFSQYDDKLPNKLRQPIESAKSSLNAQRRVLIGTFIVFSILAVVPVICVVWFWRAKYYVIPLELWLFAPGLTDIIRIAPKVIAPL